MNRVPTLWEALLLAGGAYRIWRLLAADVILDKPRDWFTRRDEWEETNRYRGRLDAWMHCPWCFGFWISLAVWASWLILPTGTLIICTPLLISAAVALVAKHWDA